MFAQDDISCVFEGIDGVGGIFISNLFTARNQKILIKNSIKAVITAAKGAITQYPKEVVDRYLYIPAEDHQSFDLSAYFKKTFTFIDAARRETNVLVHCVAGISRSATIVIAYLLQKYGYTQDLTLSLVKRRRDIISPNCGFLKQIEELSRKIAHTPEKQKSMGACRSVGLKNRSLSKSSRLMIARLSASKQIRDLQNYSPKTLNAKPFMSCSLKIEETPKEASRKAMRFSRLRERKRENALICEGEGNLLLASPL